MKCIVTGAAGFIGSNLCDRLLALGHIVVGVDNLSTGRIEFLSHAEKNKNFDFIQVDLLTPGVLDLILRDANIIYHLAANADVRYGTIRTRVDLEQNIIVTHNILESMRIAGCNTIAFSSTGSVYGEAVIIPTPEDAPFPVQTSLYGASKLSGEGLISAYSEGFGFNAFIFRFVSILGERYTHGHIFDFYESLKADPFSLSVLGNGRQKKSYLYVQDCIDAMFLAVDSGNSGVNIFNLGVDDYCEVNDSIGWICSELGVSPSVHYSGGEKGWIGDNPFIFLDTKKIQKLGWKPKLSIEEGVVKTVQFLHKNQWVFNTNR
jgi:UDP-glucose 4-epimerase